MSLNTRIRAIEPDGRVLFIRPEQAISLIKGGDAWCSEPGSATIYLREPAWRGLRGPSCSVQGLARGRAADGLPRLSQLEKYALGSRVRDRATGEVLQDYGEELAEIGAIHHRILRSVAAG